MNNRLSTISKKPEIRLLQKLKLKLINHMRRQLKLEYGEWSYAQEGEDLILMDLFKEKSLGFYVDVGSFHPRRFSNTHRFYKRGWEGINIDPTPGTIRAFERERPRDINLELGIAKSRGELKFFEFSEPALNTFSEEVAIERRKTWNEPREITVRTAPLASVLREHLPDSTSIDFLDVDTEGYDLEVLESNDWHRFRPTIVLVEALAARALEAALDDPTTIFMKSKGYVALCKTLRTLIFAEENLQLI